MKRRTFLEEGKLKITDGGRLSCGFLHESLDCVPRSIAIAANISYAESHEICRRHGRKSRHKTKHTRILFDQMFEKYPISRKITVNQILPELHIGRYIVLINGHTFAVINGIIHDTLIVGKQSRVKGLWLVKEKE